MLVSASSDRLGGSTLAREACAEPTRGSARQSSRRPISWEPWGGSGGHGFGDRRDPFYGMVDSVSRCFGQQIRGVKSRKAPSQWFCDCVWLIFGTGIHSYPGSTHPPTFGAV